MNEDNNQGWIILSVVLGLVIIICIIIIFALLLQKNSQQINEPNICPGEYSIITGEDANEIRSCGQDRAQPCIFTKLTINDCIAECDALRDICRRFTYNQFNQTMKIVNENSTYETGLSNLYIRN